MKYHHHGPSDGLAVGHLSVGKHSLPVHFRSARFVAHRMGWRPVFLQVCPSCFRSFNVPEPVPLTVPCPSCGSVLAPCEHENTDGRTTCSDCGAVPHEFRISAIEYLSRQSGRTVRLSPPSSTSA